MPSVVGVSEIYQLLLGQSQVYTLFLPRDRKLNENLPDGFSFARHQRL
jgi:hypothetical protein